MDWLYCADQLSLSDSDSSKSSLRNSGIDEMTEVEIADGLEVGFKSQIVGVARILFIRRLEMYNFGSQTHKFQNILLEIIFWLRSKYKP